MLAPFSPTEAEPAAPPSKFTSTSVPLWLLMLRLLEVLLMLLMLLLLVVAIERVLSLLLVEAEME